MFKRKLDLSKYDVLDKRSDFKDIAKNNFKIEQVNKLMIELKNSKDYDSLENDSAESQTSDIENPITNLNYRGKKIQICKFSLNFFSKNNKLRSLCLRICQLKSFDYLISIIIMFQTILVVLQSYPQDHNHNKDQIHKVLLLYLNPVFTTFYATEMFIKLIAFGFMDQPNSFISETTNLLNVVVLLLESFQYKNFVFIRLTALLEILAQLQQFKYLKRIIMVIEKSKLQIFIITFIQLFFIIFFAILGRDNFGYILSQFCRTTNQPINGVWMLKQPFQQCENSNSCGAGYYCGSDYQYGLVNQQINQNKEFDYNVMVFDNLLKSMISVFKIVMIEGWASLYFKLRNLGIIYTSLIYFLIIIILCNFLIQNILIATFKSNFYKFSLDEESKQFHEINSPTQIIVQENQKVGFLQRFMDLLFYKINIPKDHNKIQGLCYVLTYHPFSVYFIYFLIFLNSMSLSLDEGQSDTSSSFQIMNLICISYFAFECVFKIIGLGYQSYFSDQLNIFDLVVTFLSWIDYLIQEDLSYISVLRIMRMLRILNLVEDNKSFEILQKATYKFLPYLFGYSIVVFLYLLMMLLLFMNLYSGQLKFDRFENLNDQGQNGSINFDNMSMSFLMVYQMFFNEQWTNILLVIIQKNQYSSLLIIFHVYISRIILYNLLISILLVAIKEGKQNRIKNENQILTLMFEQIMLRKSKQKVQQKIFRRKYPLRYYYQKFQKEIKITQQIQQRDPLHFNQINNNNFLNLNNDNSIDHSQGTSSDENSEINSNDQKKLQKKLNSDLQQYQKSDDQVIMDDQVNGLVKGSFFNKIQFFQNISQKSEDEQEQQSIQLNSQDLNSPNLNSQKQQNLNLYSSSNKPRQFVKSNTLNINQNQLIDLTQIQKHKSQINRVKDKNQQNQTNESDNLDYKIKKDLDFELPRHQKILIFFQNSSWFIFHKDSYIRRSCTQMIQHSYWDKVIITFIVINSIMLAFYDPLSDPKSSVNILIDQIDDYFTIFFFLEFLIKTISMGFIYNKKNKNSAYLRDVWNLMDFIVTLFTMLIFTLESSSEFSTFKSLRILRVLKPLKVISNNEHLKIIVNALFLTIPALFNLVFIVAIFLASFAIILRQIFKNKFYYCDISKFSGNFDPSLIINKNDCLQNGGIWLNKINNFDNIGNAYISLILFLTGEDYMQIIHSSMNAVDINQQPQQERQIFWIYFYFIVLILMLLIILNLYSTITIDNFQTMKQELEGSQQMNIYQKEFIHLQKCINRRNIKNNQQRPHDYSQAIAYDIVNSSLFNLLSLLTLFVYGISQIFLSFINENDIYVVFVVIFNLEIALKIFAYRSKFLQDYWNQFDLSILIFGNIELLIQSQGYQFLLKDPFILKTVKLIQLIQLLSKLHHYTEVTLKIILKTFYYCFFPILNNMIIFILILFIYTVLGIRLFGQIKLDPFDNSENIKFANFHSFLNSLTVLIMCATFQKWDYFMIQLAYQKPGCVIMQEYQDIQKNGLNTCGTPLSYIYFFSFMLICPMMLVHLITASIIQAYEEQLMEQEAVLTPIQLDSLIQKWSEYDAQGTGFISSENLAYLILGSPPPIGIKERNQNLSMNEIKEKQFQGYFVNSKKKIALDYQQMINIMKEIDLPLYEDNQVHFRDFSIYLITKLLRQKYKFKEQKIQINSEYLKNQTKKCWYIAFPGLEQIDIMKLKEEPVQCQHMYAMMKICQIVKQTVFKYQKELEYLKRNQSQLISNEFHVHDYNEQHKIDSKDYNDNRQQISKKSHIKRQKTSYNIKTNFQQIQKEDDEFFYIIDDQTMQESCPFKIEYETIEIKNNQAIQNKKILQKTSDQISIEIKDNNIIQCQKIISETPDIFSILKNQNKFTSKIDMQKNEVISEFAIDQISNQKEDKSPQKENDEMILQDIEQQSQFNQIKLNSPKNNLNNFQNNQQKLDSPSKSLNIKQNSQNQTNLSSIDQYDQINDKTTNFPLKNKFLKKSLSQDSQKFDSYENLDQLENNLDLQINRISNQQKTDMYLEDFQDNQNNI